MARWRAVRFAAAAALVGTASLTPALAQAPAQSGDGRAQPEARESEDGPDAAADDAPDLAFLEYLGSWQADDDEWLLIAEWHEDEAADAAKDESGTRAERRAAAEGETRRERAQRKDDEEGG
jgi:hypothetical protein